MDVKKQLFTDAETNTVSSSGNNEDAGWEEVIVHRVAETKMMIMMSRMIQVMVMIGVKKKLSQCEKTSKKITIFFFNDGLPVSSSPQE